VKRGLERFFKHARTTKSTESLEFRVAIFLSGRSDL
jgi:hypothetical protein